MSDELAPPSGGGSIEHRPETSTTPTWARVLTKLLDDLIKIPGTEQGIGLDALLGLIPGVGDSATGLGSMALLVLALRKRVPTVIILKMLGNILVDVVTGTIPVLGDIFDVAWRSNRRNLDLIEKHGDAKEAPSAADYALVVTGFLLAALAIAAPFLVGATIGYKLAQLMGL